MIYTTWTTLDLTAVLKSTMRWIGRQLLAKFRNLLAYWEPTGLLDVFCPLLHRHRLLNATNTTPYRIVQHQCESCHRIHSLPGTEYHRFKPKHGERYLIR